MARASCCCSPPDRSPASWLLRSERTGNNRYTSSMEVSIRSASLRNVQQAEAQVVGHRHRREDRPAARHQRDARSDDLLGGLLGDRLSVERDRPGRGGEPADGLEDRRLAGAIGSQQRDDLALGHVEVHAEQHLQLAVAHVDIGRPEQRGGPGWRRATVRSTGIARDREVHHRGIAGRARRAHQRVVGEVAVRGPGLSVRLGLGIGVEDLGHDLGRVLHRSVGRRRARRARVSRPAQLRWSCRARTPRTPRTPRGPSGRGATPRDPCRGGPPPGAGADRAASRRGRPARTESATAPRGRRCRRRSRRMVASRSWVPRSPAAPVIAPPIEPSPPMVAMENTSIDWIGWYEPARAPWSSSTWSPPARPAIPPENTNPDRVTHRVGTDCRLGRLPVVAGCDEQPAGPGSADTAGERDAPSRGRRGRTTACTAPSRGRLVPTAAAARPFWGMISGKTLGLRT